MRKSIALIMVLLVLLSACGPQGSTITPVDVSAVQTSVVQTVFAGATQTAVANVPTDTPVPTETLTPEASPTPSTQCKGALTGIVLTMPNNLWSCSVRVLEGGDGAMEVIDVSSPVFKISTGYRVGRGPWCEPQSEICVVTPFYKNEMVDLSLFKWNGENKEIYGHIQQGEIRVLFTIKYLNMETRELTKIEMDELFHFIDSITFEHK